MCTCGVQLSTPLYHEDECVDYYVDHVLRRVKEDSSGD